MNAHLLHAALLSAMCALSFSAQAAPSKKAKANKSKNTVAAAKETKNAVSDSPFSPQKHKAAYAEFCERLKEIANADSFNLGRAYYAVLKATNDEFCIDEWMQQASDEGYPVAQLFVAQKTLYRVPQDKYLSPEVRAAVVLLRNAAAQKYAPAQLEYSTCLKAGIGTLKNESAAFKALQEACASGNFNIRFAWLMESGRIDKYEDMERPEVKAEIERGNHYLLYYFSLLAPDAQTRLSLLFKAVDAGNDYATYNYSELIFEQDTNKSFAFLKKAVAKHNPDATFRLASYLLNPPVKLEALVGPIKDPKTGVLFLKMASMLGNADSRAELARLYLSGEYGTTPSDEKAYKHCAQGAAISGTPELLAAQGFMLLCGKGTKQDTERGKQLLELAASGKYPYAKVLLGYAHYHGIGVEQSASQARFYMEDAALQQFPLAFVYLALLHDTPVSGINPDPSRSKYYLEHAEREMPGKATDLFKKLKNQEGGWTPSPLQLRKL